jgi:hypothetical protein
MHALLIEARNFDFIEQVYPYGEYHHAVIKQGLTNIQFPVEIEASLVHPSIEDVFIDLMRNHGK